MLPVQASGRTNLGIERAGRLDIVPSKAKRTANEKEKARIMLELDEIRLRKRLMELEEEDE